MSEPTFSKYFKTATGMTFSSMVKKLRIAYARRLLDTTEHSVAQVAEMSGYHNMANFNRQFLAEVGTHADRLPPARVRPEAAARALQPGSTGAVALTATHGRLPTIRDVRVRSRVILCDVPGRAAATRGSCSRFGNQSLPLSAKEPIVQIGVPRESRPRETRVAATPKTVGQLVGLGYDVAVESGAGALASFSDEAYAAAGARVVDAEEAWGSDIVHKVNAPSDEEIARLRPGTVLVSLMAPALSPELVEKLRAAGVTAMAMDAVPRISRAQSLDVLSSMANIAGYRAVVEAAHEFGSFFTGQVTAAGKVPPAKVLVAGAGVAGLAAIGTARSLGAIVRATDARAEVAEQVESMGAEFLAVQMPEVDAAASSSDGYAKEMGEEYNRRAAELYAAQAPDADIIVTTALIPGRPAPRLITGEMVAAMKPGSVIVDMAAANGGNVEGSVADEMVLTANGVRIIGYTDLAARLPTQASQLYGTNLVNLMKLLTPGKDGQLVLDFDDVVQRNMTVARDGELLWPPPAIQVSAAPVVAARRVEAGGQRA